MLHIINKSPFIKGSLESCLRVAQKNDPIILIEDAVLGVQPGSSVASMIQAARKDREIYALGPDLQARGIDKMVEGVKAVDYAGFVDLVEQSKTMSWL